MKANKLSCKDLMIGDWVMYDPNEFIEDEYEPYKEPYPCRIESGEQINDAVNECYSPIPLTAEILEKNGFEVQDQGGGRKDVWIGFGIDCEGDIEVEFQHNIPTHLKIDGVFKGEYYTSTNIKYVHLLQHALRLCGIDKEIKLED